MSAENAALDTAAYCITTELEVKQTMKSVNADALARHKQLERRRHGPLRLS